MAMVRFTEKDEIVKPEEIEPIFGSRMAMIQFSEEDKIDKPEKIEPPLATVPFSRLFACADNLN